ncbi:MAG: cupin domain-containing protein [Alphaproteobacteria bacterium]
MPPADIIRLLDLQPHPEGGHYRETFRDPVTDGTGRARSTVIYFLLAAGERSHWHRVDAAETWFWHAGAPLALSVSTDGETVESVRLGPGLTDGPVLHHVIPPHAWQAAESEGNWTLVSCTVAPGFEFDGFELAPPEWTPGK